MLSSNWDKGVGSGGAGEPKVHESDVGSMTTKFSYSLHGIRRLRHEMHVRLRADDRSQPLAKDRMILYAQDTNGFGLSHDKGLSRAIVMVCVCSRQRLERFLMRTGTGGIIFRKMMPFDDL